MSENQARYDIRDEMTRRMIMDDLTRAALNHDITTLLAVCKNGKMWMRVNPAQGTIMYTVTANGGRAVCETLSLERAILVYNGIEKECEQ